MLPFECSGPLQYYSSVFSFAVIKSPFGDGSLVILSFGLLTLPVTLRYYMLWNSQQIELLFGQISAPIKRLANISLCPWLSALTVLWLEKRCSSISQPINSQKDIWMSFAWMPNYKINHQETLFLYFSPELLMTVSVVISPKPSFRYSNSSAMISWPLGIVV